MNSTIPKAALLCCAALLFAHCRPKKDNIEPVADTETQSAVEASWATFVITDIDQICAFAGEDQMLKHFYVPDPAISNNGTITAIRDVSAEVLVMGWNKTQCVDGKMRDGSIFMYYKMDPLSNPHANPNSKYYREFGFVGRVSLSDYKVDGWLIKNYDNTSPAYVYNQLTTALYDPTQVKLTWKIAGKFRFIHPTDSNKNMVWDGELIKTLENTADKDIFNPNRQSAINWVRTDVSPQKAALVSYYGRATGLTSRTVPYTFNVNRLTPLVRDFMCSSDPVSGVTASAGSTSLKVGKEEFHPFIKGIANFTTGAPEQNIYPRQIYFGNEGSPQLQPQCDNTGEILIKGNSYRVNFIK